MCDMDNTEILYQLTVEDFQKVAEENLNRVLTRDEIEKVLAFVSERIPWYDLICNGIQELGEESPNQQESMLNE